MPRHQQEPNFRQTDIVLNVFLTWIQIAHIFTKRQLVLKSTSSCSKAPARARKHQLVLHSTSLCLHALTFNKVNNHKIKKGANIVRTQVCLNCLIKDNVLSVFFTWFHFTHNCTKHQLVLQSTSSCFNHLNKIHTLKQARLFDRFSQRLPSKMPTLRLPVRR